MHKIIANQSKEKSIIKHETNNTKKNEGRKTSNSKKKKKQKTKEREMNYFKFFVHVLFMGKDLLVGRRVISIQFTKDNSLQGVVLNALMCLIIPSTANNIKTKRNKKK